VLPAVDARRGERDAHGGEALHLAVFGQVVAPLVGDDSGHQRVTGDAAGQAVLAAARLHDLCAGLGGLRICGLADGVPLLAHVHPGLLHLKVLVLVPADDGHRLGAVAIWIVAHGFLAGDAGGDAVRHAIALAGAPLLLPGAAGVGILAHAVNGLGDMFLGGLQLLVAHGQLHLLLAEVEAQLVGVVRMKLLAAATVYLALEHLHHLVQPRNIGILGGDDGGLVGYHAAQPVNDPGAALLGDILAPDAPLCCRQVLYVLLARHCRTVCFTGTKVRKNPGIRKTLGVNKCYSNLLNIKAFPTGGRRVDTLHEKHQLVPSELIENGCLMLLEHLAADAPYLHTLVVYHIPAALPVEQLHQRAAAVEVDVHTAVGRLAPTNAGKAAQRLNSLAEIYTRAVDHELVRFVQTKHNSTYFAGAKVQSPRQMQNTSKMGWLR